MAIVRAAWEQCRLDRVIFLPCWQSPHKGGRSPAAPEHRLAMLELATAGHAWAEVDDWEIRRGCPSYSWLTAEHFRAELPEAELFWVLGADQWQALPRWAKPERLAELLHFIVFPRGTAPEPMAGFAHQTLDVRHPASSTEVRRRIARSDTTDDLLSPEVASYIRREGLYR